MKCCQVARRGTREAIPGNMKPTTLRKGNTAVMLRPYSVNPTVEGSPSIARGATVTIVSVRKTVWNERAHTVTDGIVTITDLPRHVLK